MGKFIKGEIALHVGAGMIPVNAEVEVVDVGPWPAGYGSTKFGTPNKDPSDYLCELGGAQFFCDECHLRKRPQPGDQIQKFRETLKPCDPAHLTQLDRWLNPVPAELEARVKAIFPSIEEINGGRDA
jgi:hypothetical protein